MEKVNFVAKWGALIYTLVNGQCIVRGSISACYGNVAGPRAIVSSDGWWLLNFNCISGKPWNKHLNTDSAQCAKIEDAATRNFVPSESCPDLHVGLDHHHIRHGPGTCFAESHLWSHDPRLSRYRNLPQPDLECSVWCIVGMSGISYSSVRQFGGSSACDQAPYQTCCS